MDHPFKQPRPAGNRAAGKENVAGGPTPKEKYSTGGKAFNPAKAELRLKEFTAELPDDLAGELTKAVNVILRAHLAGDTGPDAGEKAAQVYAEQAKTLRHAITPRERLPQVVAGLLAARSLNIFFSPPARHKTNLVLDLCMAVASGSRWLPDMPGKGMHPGQDVHQGPVLWIDVDSGEDVLSERLAAFMRGYNACEDSPFYWLSFATPPVAAAKGITELSAYAQSIGAVLIVFDNLLRAAGVKDENSSEMDVAMLQFRRLAEDTGAAVVLIHHQRKPSNQKGGDSERAGATLRGHSSIEAALDAAFLIDREDDANDLSVRCTKARRKPVAPFGARFTFEPEPDSDLLRSARFYRADVLTPSAKKLEEAKGQVLSILARGEMNTGDLYSAVRFSKAMAGAAIAELVGERKIKSHRGDRGAIIYARV